MDDQGRRPVQELLLAVEPLDEMMTVAAAADRIAAAGSGLPVVDRAGKLVGYLGERALLQALTPGYLRDLHDTEFLTRDLSTLTRCVRAAAQTHVGDHMAREPVYVDTDDSEMHAAELFLHHGMGALPVLDDAGRVVGVLRLGDLIADLMRRHAGDGPPTAPSDQ